MAVPPLQMHHLASWPHQQRHHHSGRAIVAPSVCCPNHLPLLSHSGSSSLWQRASVVTAFQPASRVLGAWNGGVSLAWPCAQPLFFNALTWHLVY